MELREQLVKDFPTGVSYRENLAYYLGDQAKQFEADENLEQAEATWRRLLKLGEELIASHPEVVVPRAHLIWRQAYFAHFLLKVGKSAEARVAYRHYCDLVVKGAADFPEEERIVECLPDVAWFLATCPEAEPRDPARLVVLAKKCLERNPQSAMAWNALGVAQYRAGNWNAAIAALEKSEALEPDKHTAFSAFFLAMSHWQLGHPDVARAWNDKAVAWMEKNEPKNQMLICFRTEAAALLGKKVP
jgi:tetratricopeptide (TPR) repeat protein